MSLQQDYGTNATTEGAGTKTAVWDDTFNVLNGWLYVPTTAETRIMPDDAEAGNADDGVPPLSSIATYAASAALACLT
jgi:hypothetical protein